MNVVAVCCLKNEADIVEPLIRHTCSVVDQMVVVDNGSDDESLQILRALQEEGLPLEISQDLTLGQFQHQRMTRLVCAEAAGRLNADWIIPLDADEFLSLPPGMPLVPPEASAHACFHLPWRCYVATPEVDKSEINPVSRIRRRRVVEPYPTSKAMIPGALARLPGAALEQGSHYLWVKTTRAPHTLHPHAWLSHFPLRGPAQYLTRIVTTTLAYLSMPDRELHWGAHCREPFEWLKTHPEKFESTFYVTAQQYGIPHASERGLAPELVEDPIRYLGGPLRYTAANSEFLSGLRALLGMAENLAMRHASLISHASSEHSDQSREEAGILAQLQSKVFARDRIFSQEVARLEGLVAGLKKSWTWRCGNLITAPARALRSVLYNCRNAVS